MCVQTKPRFGRVARDLSEPAHPSPRLLNIPETNVRVIYHEASGSYGRMSNDDGAEDAALMSRAVGAPVRVQWSRQDEHGWEPKGPAQTQVLKAGIDGDGKIIAWEFTDYSFPWTVSSLTTLLASQQVGIKSKSPGSGNGNQGGGEIYAFENSKVIAEEIPGFSRNPFLLRTSNLRAPGQLSRCFASETLLNEIAADLSVDPVEFRLRYLTGDQRGIDVLKAVAAKFSGRSAPPCCHFDRSDSDRQRSRNDAAHRRLCCGSSRR